MSCKKDCKSKSGIDTIYGLAEEIRNSCLETTVDKSYVLGLSQAILMIIGER